jgi:hypothetical protein
MNAGALEDSRGYKTRGFGIFDFSREGGDFGKFSPIFPLRGYYINPVALLKSPQVREQF